MNKIAEQLLALCYTQTEAARALRTIKDYLNHQFFSPGAAKPSLDKEQTDLINKLGGAFFAAFKIDKLAPQLSQLEKMIEQAELVTIYIPFEMPPTEVQRLGEWIKSNLGEQSLLDLKFDSSLIGGCALSLKGVYKDYSLKAELKDNHEAVMKSLVSFKS